MPQIDLLNAVFMFLKDTSLFFRGGAIHPMVSSLFAEKMVRLAGGRGSVCQPKSSRRASSTLRTGCRRIL